MIQVHSFTFNPFQENTYILSNAAGEAILIDPGMYDQRERDVFFDFIEQEGLRPAMLLNTHTHIDHVFGNSAVLQKFNIPFRFHSKDLPVFKAAASAAALYALDYEASPEPSSYLDEETLQFGDVTFKLLFTPGHSPGSVCLYNAADEFVIAGDVLFQMSIGRTDLPGGSYDELMKSIHSQLMPLPDGVKVYCGHGPSTTIGFEKMNNPFLKN